MELVSGAFAARQPVPRRYPCEREDFSSPLAWSGVPADIVSFALIVDDPGAPVGTFAYWLARSLQDGGLAADHRAPREVGNDFGEVGYRVRALRVVTGHTGTSSAFTRSRGKPTMLAGAGRKKLDRAIEGSIVAVAEFVGRYER